MLVLLSPNTQVSLGKLGFLTEKYLLTTHFFPLLGCLLNPKRMHLRYTYASRDSKVFREQYGQ